VAVASLEDLTTDQLLARAKELESSASLLHSLTRNPETRETIQRAIKKINPNLSIPEIDAKDAVLAVVSASEKRVEKLENDIRERDIRERLEKQRAGLMVRYNLSESDMLAVEALMVDKDNPIPSYDAAARVYVASKQSAVPTPSAFSPPTVYEMPEKETWAGGIANPAKLNHIAMNEASRAMSEIMGGKVAGLGPNRAA
jgi:hypothetical protein